MASVDVPRMVPRDPAMETPAGKVTEKTPAKS